MTAENDLTRCWRPGAGVPKKSPGCQSRSWSFRLRACHARWWDVAGGR